MSVTDLAISPEYYPIAVDSQTDAVRFVRLSETDYREASFLDNRLLSREFAEEWWPWAEVRPVAESLPARCHFVFHISHVGSTLLSRLLGEHPAFFSLREPVLLRRLAELHLALDQPERPWDRAEFTRRTGAYIGLWSRTFRPEQTAVIKATSYVAEMATELMERVPGARAIFLYVPPPTFLMSLLGGAMSDITGLAEQRLERLHRRLGARHWRLADLPPGESVAMSWLSEMFALEAASNRFPDRILWMDFNRYLSAPERGLTAALEHLGIRADERFVREVLSGPIPTHYAKAPAHRYDARTREQLLHQAQQTRAAEIRRGLDWLVRATALPPVRAVIAAASRR